MDEKKIINLTPHAITVFLGSGDKLVIPPAGTVARVKQTKTQVGQINGIPVFRTVLGSVEGLPAPEKDTVFIVSSIVLSAVRGRTDVVAPDTNPDSAVRDEKGNIVGVKAFLVGGE